MKRVAASPESLTVLSLRLANQGEDYRRIGARLRADADLGLGDLGYGDLGSAALAVALAAEDSARVAFRLANLLADLSNFVRTTAHNLESADQTLAGAVRQSTNPVGVVTVRSAERSYRFFAQGTRRGYGRTFDGPRPRERQARVATAGSGEDRDVRRRVDRVVTVASKSATVGRGASGRKTWGGASGSVGADYFGGLSATGTASFGVGDRGVAATVSARVLVGAEANVSATVGSERLGATGRASVVIGAMAEGRATASIGRDGVALSAEARAMVGVEVSASGRVTAVGVTARGEAGVIAGVGAEASADVDFGLDQVGIKVELGVALGLGGHLALDLEVNPKAVAGEAIDVAGDVAGAIGDRAGTAIGGSFAQKVKELQRLAEQGGRR